MKSSHALDLIFLRFLLTPWLLQPNPTFAFLQSINNIPGSQIFRDQQLSKSSCSSNPPESDATLEIHEQTQIQTNSHYRRDPCDENAAAFFGSLTPTQQEELQSFLEEIYASRKMRQYDRSDDLVRQVRRRYGVRVYHDPPVWNTQRNGAPPTYIKKQHEKLQRNLREEHGPTGHPYKQVGNEINPTLCPLSLPQIHSLLSKQAFARKEGRYEEADAVQFELQINGVEVNDSLRQWRADGADGWETSHSLGSSKASRLSYKAQQTDSGVENRGLDLHEPSPEQIQFQARIEQLVTRRADAVGRGDTNLVHFLSMELQSTYGVSVDDKGLTWSFASNSNTALTPLLTKEERKELVPSLLFDSPHPSHSSYQPSQYSQPVGVGCMQQRVNDMIEERNQKRLEGKFKEADALRNELWKTYHVGLNDRLRQWSVGGVFDHKSG